jgi:hypothetical protein
VNAKTNQAEQWTLEGGSPAALTRGGWKKDSVKVGDEIKREVPPREGRQQQLPAWLPDDSGRTAQRIRLSELALQLSRSNFTEYPTLVSCLAGDERRFVSGVSQSQRPWSPAMATAHVGTFGLSSFRSDLKSRQAV